MMPNITLIVENIEGAVRAKRQEIVRVDDSRHGGLAEKEQLRDDADGFKDDGKRPHDLSLDEPCTFNRICLSRPTCENLKPYGFSLGKRMNIAATGVASTAAPPRQ